jgi:hypothetical protein
MNIFFSALYILEIHQVPHLFMLLMSKSANSLYSLFHVRSLMLWVMTENERFVLEKSRKINKTRINWWSKCRLA